jgi:general secretion pathway protein D
METFKPISPIRRRAAVMLVGVCLMVPASAEEPLNGRNLADKEYSRRSAAVQEAQQLLLNGDEAYKAGRFAEAVEAFAGAREMLPDAPVSSDLRAAATERYAQASVEQARVLSRNGDVAGAKAVVDKVLRDGVAPNHAGALAFRAQLDDPIRTNPALTVEHAKDVDSVRRLLYVAEGAFNLGKLDESKTNYEKVLRIDPTNTAARRGMEQVATAKSQYQKASYDHTRSEMLSQVDAAWETVLTAPDVGPGPGEPGMAETTMGTSMTVAAKLDRIIIPKVQLDQATLQESLNFLRSRAAECDTTELDPSRKGVNFNLNLGPEDTPASKRILSEKVDLKLTGVPLSKALKYLTELTHTSYSTDEFSVIIAPLGTTSDEMISRSYRVLPDFITSMSGGGAAAKNEDPFASGSPKKGLLTTRLTAKEALMKEGVPFPEGANASYSPETSMLRVTNTAINQNIIAQLVETMTHTEPVMVSVRVTMIKTQRTVLEELGFDTVITPIPMNADGSLVASGGAVGNGSPRKGADFVSPPMTGIPADPNAVVNPGVLTNGLRSGGFALKSNDLDGLVNNMERTSQQDTVAPGVLAVTGLFNDGQVQTLMRGLDQKASVDIMSQPSTITRSGQQASISIVREFIYPTEYDPPQIPSSVNTNGGGGSAPVTPANPTSFEKKDVGVILEVTPTADADKRFVDISLNPSFTNFDGFVNYGTPIKSIQKNLLGVSETVEVTKNAILMPVFSVQRLNTQLTVLDGSTIVIGGLMSDNIQKVEDKVPLLGGIPLLGRLFRTEARKPITTAIIFLVHLELIDPTGRPYRNR